MEPQKKSYKNSAIAIVVLIVLAIIFVLIVSSSGKTAAGPLKIGVIIPRTGDAAITGEKIYKGVRIAESEIGSKAQFIYEDSHSKPTDAVTAAHKLLDVDHVDVIIGTYVPEEAMAVAPAAKAAGKFVFTFSYCSDAFAQYDNLFCGYPTAEDQIKTAFKAITDAGVKKMAIVDSNSDFGINSQKVVEKYAPELGYSIVHNDLVKDLKDFRTTAAKIKSAGADAVFTATDAPSGALLLAKQLKEAGFNGMRITFIDVDTKNLKDFGSSVEGTLAPGIAPSNFSQHFMDAFKKANTIDPDYTSALGFDVAHYVVGAMEKGVSGGANVGEQVKSYAYENPAIKNFKYKDDRTVIYDMELWTVKNGEYVKYGK